MPTTDHLYLSHEAIRDLATVLAEIPDVAEDLEDAVTRRARHNAPSHRLSSRTSDQPLPFSPTAARARDHLHATLVAWVRLICEQRAVPYKGDPTTPGLSRWLHRNLIAFAMTEGVESAPAEIRSAVDAALNIISPAPAKLTINASQLAAARRTRLNMSGIATLARELGEPFAKVTVRRIQTLRDAGKITPIPGPWSPDCPEQFTVGEVLDAHLAHPMRQRKSPHLSPCQ